MAGTSTLLAAWRGAQLAEIAWLDPDGRPDLAVVVPLLDRSRPATALTYDRLSVARRIAASTQAALAVATPATANGHRPLATTATLEVEEDPTGTTFTDHLLPQELAKHPPSRSRADSLLLRREHWWYVPRLLVRAREVGPPRELPVRDAIAAVGGEDGLMVTTVDLGLDERPGAVRLRSWLPDGPAAILQHGADVPDLERPWHRRWWGVVEGGRLVVDRWDVRPPRERPEGLWRRWRAEVELRRACRVGLREAGLD